MNETKQTGIDWHSLVLGILFVLAALVAFQDPAGNLAALVIVFAVFAIIKGIFELFVRNRLKELLGYKAYAPIILGVVDLLIGVYFLFHLNVGVSVLSIIFALWFILDSFFGLLILDLAKAVSVPYYWFTMIICILGIILGVVLFVNPLFSALTLSFFVGFYFMLFGMTHIVYAFR